MKSVQIPSFFWSIFSVIGLNTEIYSVNLRIQSEYGKMQTRKTLYLDTFHVVVLLKMKISFEVMLNIFEVSYG